MPCHCSGNGDDESDCFSNGNFNSCPSAPSLFQYIDIDNINALNEKVRGSVKRIFKPHHLRSQTEFVRIQYFNSSSLVSRK